MSGVEVGVASTVAFTVAVAVAVALAVARAVAVAVGAAFVNCVPCGPAGAASRTVTDGTPAPPLPVAEAGAESDAEAESPPSLPAGGVTDGLVEPVRGDDAPPRVLPWVAPTLEDSLRTGDDDGSVSGPPTNAAATATPTTTEAPPTAVSAAPRDVPGIHPRPRRGSPRWRCWC